MGHSQSQPFQVVSLAFFLDKGFFADTQLPLASLASDFKIREICQQKSDVEPKFRDLKKLELR